MKLYSIQPLKIPTKSKSIVNLRHPQSRDQIEIRFKSRFKDKQNREWSTDAIYAIENAKRKLLNLGDDASKALWKIIVINELLKDAEVIEILKKICTKKNYSPEKFMQEVKLFDECLKNTNPGSTKSTADSKAFIENRIHALPFDTSVKTIHAIEVLNAILADSDDNKEVLQTLKEHLRLDLMPKVFQYVQSLPLNSEKNKNTIINPFVVSNPEFLSKINATVQEAKSKIVGQPHQINTLAEIFETECIDTPETKAALFGVPVNRPRSISLLLGPSGVGKTESVKVFADAFDRELIIVPFSQYKDNTMAVSAFVGSGPGYVGANSKSVAIKIKEAVLRAEQNNTPGPILLLDELEKGNDELFDVLMQLFDQGELIHQTTGENIPTRGLSIIATSNACAKQLVELKHTDPDISYKRYHAAALEYLTESGIFKNEFLGRIDHKIPFYFLDPKEAKKLLESFALKTRLFLKNYGCDLMLSQELTEWLLQTGVSPERGARDLKVAYQKAFDQAWLSYKKHRFFQNRKEDDTPTRLQLEYNPEKETYAFTEFNQR